MVTDDGATLCAVVSGVALTNVNDDNSAMVHPSRVEGDGFGSNVDTI